MKAVAAMMLVLLALVHHHAHAGGQRQAGHTWKHDDVDADHDGGHRRSPIAPLTGLRQCVTICGSGVTSCMLDCYRPLIDLDPVQLPVCLLRCTNDAMLCATRCPVDGNDV